MGPSEVNEVFDGGKHCLPDALAGWAGGAVGNLQPDGAGLACDDPCHLSTVSDEDPITCVP